MDKSTNVEAVFCFPTPVKNFTSLVIIISHLPEFLLGWMMKMVGNHYLTYMTPAELILRWRLVLLLHLCVNSAPTLFQPVKPVSVAFCSAEFYKLPVNMLKDWQMFYKSIILGRGCCKMLENYIKNIGGNTYLIPIWFFKVSRFQTMERSVNFIEGTRLS